MIRLDKNVLWLDVEMAHVVLVDELEGQQNLTKEFVATLVGHGLPLRQGRSLKFHHLMGRRNLQLGLQSRSTQLGLNMESALLHPGLVVANDVKGCSVSLVTEGGKSIHLLEHTLPIGNPLDATVGHLDGIGAPINLGKALVDGTKGTIAKRTTNDLKVRLKSTGRRSMGIALLHVLIAITKAAATLDTE